jgi:hypothetical protein
MSDNLEVENLDTDLEEAKGTGVESDSADATTPEGGTPKKRKGDKAGSEKADKIDVKTPEGSNDAGLHEAIEGLFEGTELTEDFKVKTVAVFEAAVHEKVLAETAVLEEKFENDENDDKHYA